jgi:primosomal protein N' (replication factor Y)
MLRVTGDVPLKNLCEMSGASPATVRKLVGDGLLEQKKVRQDRDIFAAETFLPTKPKQLTEHQQRVYDRVAKDVDGRRHAIHLIHGVTSSGKTEVYLQLIRKVLDAGRTAIVLVPEISLTPQTTERFRARFGDVVSVLHHRLSDGERHDEWYKLLEGGTKIAVGARSAVFAPLQNLGLIVVDEEHERSYKQSDIVPTYNARDIAVVRAKDENAIVLLGTATPSMESYYNAMKGKYVLSELPERIDNMPLPEMKVIDMAKGGEGSGQMVLSDVLMNGIQDRLERGEQVILFLNRRGYATILICRGCKEVVTCVHCSVPLKYHKGDNTLLCHMCGHTRPVPKTCPACKAETVLLRGYGTERVEKLLYARFPGITVLRMDFDTTRKKRSHDEILREFKSGRAEILVGTQMIAKGLHFPNVTLVGIVNADTSLYMQDFRAAENTYQLITQVSGRAGRGDVPGQVIIQTSAPDHFAIRAACHHSYREFFDREIESRKVLQYPPLLRMVAVTIRGKDVKRVKAAANDLVAESTESPHPGIDVLGPVEAPVRKAKDDFRYQVFLKSTRVSAMTHLVSDLLHRLKLPSTVRISTDVDPVDMF